MKISHCDQIVYWTMAIHIAVGLHRNVRSLIFTAIHYQNKMWWNNMLVYIIQISNWPLAFYIFIKSHDYTWFILLNEIFILTCESLLLIGLELYASGVLSIVILYCSFYFIILTSCGITMYIFQMLFSFLYSNLITFEHLKW